MSFTAQSAAVLRLVRPEYWGFSNDDCGNWLLNTSAKDRCQCSVSRLRHFSPSNPSKISLGMPDLQTWSLEFRYRRHKRRCKRRKWVALGRLRVTRGHRQCHLPFDRAHTTSDSAFNKKTMRLSCTVFQRVFKASYLSKLADFTPLQLRLAPPLGVTPVEFRRHFWHQKTRSIFCSAVMRRRFCDLMFSRFSRIPDLWRTDTDTDRHGAYCALA